MGMCSLAGRDMRTGGRLEAAVSVSNQDRNRIGVVSRNDDINVAVVLEVAGGNLVCRGPDRDRLARRQSESTPAVAEQENNLAALRVSGGVATHDDIEVAVIVEVRDDRFTRLGPDMKRGADRGGEGRLHASVMTISGRHAEALQTNT